MPNGLLATFDEGNFRGTIEYSSMTKPTRVYPGNTELVYPFYTESKPSRAYILLITETKSNSVKWRLWLNNFSLTKEFKPNYTLLQGKNFMNLHIFDVTHLVKEGRNEFVIAHASAEGILVHLINSVVFYEVPEITTAYALKGGIYPIQPYEKIDFNYDTYKNYLIIRNPNKSKLKILNGSSVIAEISERNDNDEIEAEGSISLIYESEQKNPAYLYLHYLSKMIAPKIDVEVEAKMIGNEIRLYLKNIGEMDLDKLIVNVMINGITVRFKTFTNLKVGEEIEDAFTLSKKGKLYVRLVGIRGGMRKILNKELNW